MSLSAKALAEFADERLQGARMKVIKERWLINDALHDAQVYSLCRYYANWPFLQYGPIQKVVEVGTQ